MSDEERASRTAARFQEHEAILAKNHATPILMIGVGHAPGPCPGKWVVSLAGGLPIEEAYRIITAMQDELAGRLGVR